MNPIRLLPLLAALAMIYVVAPARATDAGACYTISSQDARSYCLAKARKEPSPCYSIRNPDMRAQCLAETR